MRVVLRLCFGGFKKLIFSIKKNEFLKISISNKESKKKSLRELGEVNDQTGNLYCLNQ